MNALAPWLLPLALLAPLLLLPLLGWRAGRPLIERLALLAPLPALLLALGAPVGLTLDLPWLLLGARLQLDATGRLFLGFSALVWLLAGCYARAYLRADARRHRFWFFFLATQGANLGLCLAADLASFYLLFALMTFAAYGLVVHSGSAEARRAGRVYIVMALLAEGALVAGMWLTAYAADSLLLADLTQVAAPTAVVLLLLGFGVKVGLPLLHMWLPLAHPVAPLPASALLSGVILKAGLLGWLRFLPLGNVALPEIGTVLLSAGVLALFFGVAAGLMQREPKVLLAYSSISQMGFMALAVGAGLHTPTLWPLLLPALCFYALHHALAKSALFLGLGVAQAHGARAWVLAGLALPALALAGAPLTSGLLAKAQLKDALLPWEGGMAAWWPLLLALAAVGTGVLMLRLLWLVAARPAAAAPPGLALPWGLLLLAGWAAPWGVAPVLSAAHHLELGTLALALGPIGLAVLLLLLARRLRWRAPALPPGDLVCALERVAAALGSRMLARARKSAS